jgi:hypothetical protein
MRKIIILTVLAALFTVGCNSHNPIFPTYSPDGYYEGRIFVDYPGMGFDHSFDAELRIYNDGYSARLRDNYGASWEADHVEYSTWSDRLEIYFRVREYRWSPECGNERYDWEMRMYGRLTDYNRFTGDLESDLDPEDYHSDYCHMNYNPPPRHIGTFDFSEGFNFWGY